MHRTRSRTVGRQTCHGLKTPQVTDLNISACFSRLKRRFSGPVAALVPFRLPKCRQGFEDRLNLGNASADEIAGDDFGSDRGGSLHQVVAYGTDAFGEGKRA